MSTITHKQQKTSNKVTAREVQIRLKAARARNAQLKEAGKLPPATKDWSYDSVISLKKALSAKEVTN